MSTVNKIEVSGVTYDIEDTTARSQSGLTDEAKQALLACFQNVAWISASGQTYYDALETALYPPANLSYISAVYTQSGTVYTVDSLDSLKSDLVVTAHYSDSTTATVTNYILSGTLTAGTSTITVAYGGKTTTFSVTVTSYEKYSYSLTNEDLIKFVGSIGWTAETGLSLNNSTTSQNGRRAFVLDYGVQQIKLTNNNTTFTDSGYYPIPVPSDATSVSVAITPSSQYFGISGYTLSEGSYTRVLDDGWRQGSRTVTFTAGAYDYITIGSKYNSTGSSYPTEPSELTITFE